MAMAAAAAAQHQTKSGDIRIYFISCMLFVCIVSGGTFLAMYISLPESESSSWYPTAGIILVGIPWIFWLLTLLYTWIKRIFGIRLSPTPNKQQQQQQVHPTTAQANGCGESGTSSVTDSPVGGGGDGGGGGGAGHVRFGPAIVLGSSEDANNDNNNQTDGSSSSSLDEQHSGSGSSSLHTGTTLSSSSMNGSSVGSHESELPLFSKSS